MEKDYYQVMGVSQDVSADELQRVYRGLVKLYHPDNARDNAIAEDKFKEINEANSVLSDPIERVRYDMRREFALEQKRRDEEAKIREEKSKRLAEEIRENFRILESMERFEDFTEDSPEDFGYVSSKPRNIFAGALLGLLAIVWGLVKFALHTVSKLLLFLTAIFIPFGIYNAYKMVQHWNSGVSFADEFNCLHTLWVLLCLVVPIVSAIVSEATKPA